MIEILDRGFGETPAPPATGGGSSGTFPNVSGPPLQPDGEPYFETLRLSAGFTGDPREIRIGAAGGFADTSGLPRECRSASIGTRPDVRLIYNAGTVFPLNIYAYSRTDDLFLVVQLPNGQFRCNDDYSGLNPAVLISNPQSGIYNIWLGVFGSELGAGTLAISELTPRFR